MTPPPDLEQLAAELAALRDAMRRAERARRADIEAAHPRHRRSATNLVHYTELRRHDLQSLQLPLAELGLSSLGRCEPHVMATIEAVLRRVSNLVGVLAVDPVGAPVSIAEGGRILEDNARDLLGAPPTARRCRIMVTLPGEAASDAALVDALVAHGMDLARINCAHDDPDAWTAMIDSVHRATRERRPTIAMDLAGPKLRTGPLEPGPPVVRVGPKRTASGEVEVPARARLLDPSADCSRKGAADDSSVVDIPVVGRGWLDRRRVSDVVEIEDHRGPRRRWRVVEADGGTCIIECAKTTYVATGASLSARGPGSGVDTKQDGCTDAAVVAELAPIEQAHRVRYGDTVILTRDLAPAPVIAGASSHRIGCTLDAAFGTVQEGHRIWFDDGKIGGVVVERSPDEIVCQVTDVRPGGANLRAGKGINLPDTDLDVPALTDKDRVDLEFALEHADVVNASFVRSPDDVRELLGLLGARGAGSIGVVLKIENRRAFEQLPELLLAALVHERIGVMIARGDLAVEVGFDRLAEVQEEILWLCEAAHVPTIWATQVLDTLARTGIASRAEITDAAMAERAECVMLNKGPHIVEAMRSLDSILRRMETHQDKKRNLLRRLRSWSSPPSGDVRS